ncbi:SDR family oxidoreductase [Sulfolobus acidocaldarius]|uniref:dTDP-4-dehydrorhamnose reductase n=4 Tax=Sulfolobus acidocaldarius TaxID=2285 RepID=Q4J871_SULAC|nr:NAD(P)-dependent oxidoreductase [Sulfolobus acidocaldarius]AAY81011.1 dTDP-4-dehydrorhamnose reductase [Sulfolobus acidocaldarius DSM 639]AGE71616.1 dTDP-4-dehydrorhamnose reductase [Sulfolobus acidocaldarius N8]AGE73889.1 dTDP-4-dehydrorhamnose reductase [Sulfolobus acidocaldarius Ron12/I]ALU30164.1 NAD(P)-dependent oxidoreductase [Sulfolobus acidocaldarius]ALU30859.1 NAD(P)-dependent oxidoreductase [Sulfolobus acidocaldarius]
MVTLIIGGSGQLGQELGKLIKDSILTFSSRPIEGGIYLDTRDYIRVEDLIMKTKPEVIINTSAITDVDKCEVDRINAHSVNSLAVKHMVRAASITKSYFVQISTDYVFDGNRGNYNEDDLPNPLNYYGLTKLLGETYSLSYDYSLVIRTSGIYGSNKENFPLYVLKSLEKGSKVRAVWDMYYSPINVKQLAEAIVQLLPLRKTGILNIAGDRISRYDLALKIAKMSSLNENLIEAASYEEMSWRAKRPKDSSLDSSTVKKYVSVNLSLEEGLRRLINDVQNK